MRRPTLLRRIVSTVISIELLCAACFSVLALAHEWRSRLRAVDSTLQGRSDSLLGAIQDQEDPADNVFVDPRELRLPECDLYAVYSRSGALLQGTERAKAPLTLRTGNGFRTVRDHGRPYRVLEREALRIIDRAESGGAGLQRPITIVYAMPTSRLLHETLKAAAFYVIASVVLAGSTALLLAAAVQRLLIPIQELADAATGISASTLTFSPPQSALHLGELRPLALRMSEAMRRLQDAFTKQHQFVGDAAHELKTAVAVVRSSVQVLSLRPRSQEEYQSGLDQVLTDNERVEELVSRMLLLARLEEGTEARDQKTDFGSGISQTIESIMSYAKASGIRLEWSLPTSLVSVAVSASALSTLVSNLVVNAVQHSPAGSLVQVQARLDTTRTPSAVLEVIDQGEGIAARELPYICDRFFRTDLSRSRETGGAGLGLAICKTIVDSVDGCLAFASTEGRGTTVTVSLPISAS